MGRPSQFNAEKRQACWVLGETGVDAGQGPDSCGRFHGALFRVSRGVAPSAHPRRPIPVRSRREWPRSESEARTNPCGLWLYPRLGTVRRGVRSTGGNAHRDQQHKGSDEEDQRLVLEKTGGLVLGRVAHIVVSELLDAMSSPWAKFASLRPWRQHRSRRSMAFDIIYRLALTVNN